VGVIVAEGTGVREGQGVWEGQSVQVGKWVGSGGRVGISKLKVGGTGTVWVEGVQAGRRATKRSKNTGRCFMWKPLRKEKD